MKKIIVTFILIVFSFSFIEGQEKPVLKFTPDSGFKIVQFTDIHLQYDSYRSDSALVMMKTVIKREKPDLVMLTGDIVGSDNRKKAWLKVAQVMIDAKVPWAAMLGNHDAEYELDKEQTLNLITGLPYSLTENGPKEISGEGNYVLPIQSARSSKTAALCYVFDSQVKSRPQNNSGVCEWIDESQVLWYRDQSAAFTKQNDGTPFPALAFFHIPFPEFREIVGQSTTFGIYGEKVSSSCDLHSNLYTAMLECKDVMGVFAGHDHNNNFIGCLHDICLAYGQTSGRQAYGYLGCGARVIELYEGQRKFDSWILKLYNCNRDMDMWTPTYNKERMFFVTYPDSFVEKKLYSDKIIMTTKAGGEVCIQLCGSGVATIDWGDGSEKDMLTLSKDNSVGIYHTYPNAPIRTIAINGDNITELDCMGCNLTSLDVSKNTELRVLWCNGNQLTNLDVSKNTALTELYCYRNHLSSLDVSKNTALTWLNCYGNQLSSLDISKNTLLRRLDCYENQITSLDFSKNTALNWLICSDNQLTDVALNALFSTLHDNTNAGKIFIGGNPGEKDCNRNIVESTGWTVSKRY